MAPITLALGGLMISRVPYPSFKTMKLEKRAQVELVIAMMVVAAMLFAMPQLTAFLFSTAYVLSGPCADAARRTAERQGIGAASGRRGRQISRRERRRHRKPTQRESLAASATISRCSARICLTDSYGAA